MCCANSLLNRGVCSITLCNLVPSCVCILNIKACLIMVILVRWEWEFVRLGLAPNYKTICFAEWGNRIYQYMTLEPISLFAIRKIASRQLSSHSIRCEIRRWDTVDEIGRLCTFSPNQVDYHTSINPYYCWVSWPYKCIFFSHSCASGS